METIDESVSVQLFSNHLKKTVVPAFVHWRGRRYTITHVGLHHTLRDGRTFLHVFSVTDGNTFFKLQLDTDTLHWKLLEVASQ